jgi:predicted nucleic acid-binding protein
LLGTLGLVMIAKKRGLIAVARPVIALLKQHGMFLSESTIDRAMRLIDE